MTTKEIISDPSEIAHLLARSPIIGPLHPLQAICLPPGTEVISDASALVEELDDLSTHPIRPIWITEDTHRFSRRFLRADASKPPSIDKVNVSLPNRLDYIRRRWLTHRGVADRIVSDVLQHAYRTVILMLIDGLSYLDVNDWPEFVEPCFIDGPSITYYQHKETRRVLPEVGFPGIIGSPRLAQRLIGVGLSHSRGFSYWDRETNVISDYLFGGMPLTRVSRLPEVVEILKGLDLESTYVQVIREGLDGLAHGRRELTVEEVYRAVQAIRTDVMSLLDVLDSGPRPAALYLTADHGILWKESHDFKMLKTDDRSHPRYGTRPPSDANLATRFAFDEHEFYVYHWPYLGAHIRQNDGGVHGGLSAHESIVPFVRWEVK